MEIGSGRAILPAVVRAFGVLGQIAVASLAAALAFLTLAHGPVAVASVSSSIPIFSLTFGTTVLGAPFLVLLSLLALAVGVWSMRGGRPIDAIVLAIFAAAMLAVIVSQSAAAFAGAWELMSLSSAFVVATHHERRAVRRAAFSYVLVSQTGALCIVAALAILAVAAGNGSFARIGLAAHALTPGLRAAVLALGLAGFGSKAGLMPLHFWLPRAHPVAPPGGSALLSGAMLKVAVYGLIMLFFVLAGPAPAAWGYALVLLALASCVGGVLYALIEHDLKRLLAYHSIENIGIIVLGVGAAVLFTASGRGSLAAIALAAAIYHSMNHAAFKGLLFLGAGAVADATGTVDLERLGGLASSLRWSAPLFLIGCAAISGLPPLNGFASEWLTFRALIAGGGAPMLPVAAVMVLAIAGLALTSGLAAACFVKAYGIAFLGGPRSAASADVQPERADARTVGSALLAASCVALGLSPATVLAAILPAASSAAGTGATTDGLIPRLWPMSLVALPLLGGAAAVMLAAFRRPRTAAAWTCGSPVTAASQYTATAFSKPLRLIFGFALPTERSRIATGGASAWFPARIDYRTGTRYVFDDAMRAAASVVQRWARRARAVQGGRLRYYLAYAIAAFALAVLLAR